MHLCEKKERQRATGLGTVNNVFTNRKAGMDKADLDKVKRVVYEMSKDSAHYQNEQRKEARIQQKICKMKHQSGALTVQQLEQRDGSLARQVHLLEATRDLTHLFMHVDMDAFFASVEELEDPKLKVLPIAANYVARTFGVRSAMPGFIAKKLCPDLVFVKPNFEKYKRIALEARSVFSEVDPEFEARGLDEASLDVTHFCVQTGRSAAEVAAQLRNQVFLKTGVTCSIGIACNRLLAKVCADINKPNGQYELGGSRKEVLHFMDQLPIRKVPGIGKVTEQMLAAFDVRVGGDLQRRRARLSYLFSPISMNFFMHVSLGLPVASDDDSALDTGRKGMSCERTFSATDDMQVLKAKLASICTHLAEDLQDEQLEAKHVTLKIKEATFEVHTRSLTLPMYVDSAVAIEAAAMQLLSPLLPKLLRLIGVRAAQFKPDAAPLKAQLTACWGQYQSTEKSKGPIRVSVEHKQVAEQVAFSESATMSPMPAHRLLCARAVAASKSQADGSGTPHQVAESSMSTTDCTAFDAQRTCSIREVVCEECGAFLQRDTLQEHLDWHVACQLSSVVNGAGYIAGTGAPKHSINEITASTHRQGRSVKRRRTPKTPVTSVARLDAFVVRHP